MASHEDMVREIEGRWQSLLAQIDEICEQVGRERPIIVGVSKRHPVEKIEAAYDAGIRNFGENYAQEMVEKANQITKNINWHFIGPLQRRHAKEVARISSMIHAVETERVMNRLANLNYTGTVLMQYNLSQEETKHGVQTIEELKKLAETGRKYGLNVAGIMVMANAAWDEKTLLEKFREGRLIAEEIFGKESLYSAGMSGDWKEALMAGSTHLRIGTAIFGPRD